MWVQLKNKSGGCWLMWRKMSNSKKNQSIWFESLAGKVAEHFPFESLKLYKIYTFHILTFILLFTLFHIKILCVRFQVKCVFFARRIQFVCWLLFYFKNYTHNNKTSTSCPTAHNSFGKIVLLYQLSGILVFHAPLFVEIKIYNRKTHVILALVVGLYAICNEIMNEVTIECTTPAHLTECSSTLWNKWWAIVILQALAAYYTSNVIRIYLQKYFQEHLLVTHYSVGLLLPVSVLHLE